MASSGQSPEAREFSLVGKVEMRIALADTDDKLSSTLKTYLPPLLLKLTSEHLSVRNKVITICSHINTRTKPHSIKLPVAALVEQFKAHPHSALVRHFDLLYIQTGVRRISEAESEALFPIVARGIATNSTGSAHGSVAHGSQLFNLLLQLLEHVQLPPRGTKEDEELRKTIKIEYEDASYLASWFGKLLLFVPVKVGIGASSAGASCPGLSVDDYAFLTLPSMEDTWNPTSPLGLNLTATKARVAKFLASGIFTDEERFFPALFASADPASSVSDAGDDMMKRVLPNTNLEDLSLVQRLFSYLFGDEEPHGLVKARAPLRLKIIGLLTKSLASTGCTGQIIKLVNHGIIDPSTRRVLGENFALSISASNAGVRAVSDREATKLRTAIFTYINFVARHGSQTSLFAMAPQILGRLKDFIEGQGWPRPGQNEDLVSRGYAYEVIGLLAKAGPASLVVEPNLDVLRWLFESLATELSSNSITVSVEESLSTVLGAFTSATMSPDVVASLEDLLISQMERSGEVDAQGERKRRSTRYVAVRYANRCLPYSSVKARWIDLLAVAAGSKDRQEVSEEGKRGLSPYWYRMLNGSIDGAGDTVFPGFTEFVDFVFYRACWSGLVGSNNLTPSDVVNQLRKGFPGAFADSIMYCRSLLFHEALSDSSSSVKIDSDWERKLALTVESDEALRVTVKQKIKSMWAASQSSATSLQVLLFAFATGLMTPKSSTATGSETDRGFLDLCALSPDSLIAHIASQYAQLEPAISSNSHPTRQAAAHAFGLLASHPVVQSTNTEGVDRMVTQSLAKAGLWKDAVGASVNQVHGSVMALAFYFSRLFARTTKSAGGEEFKTYLASITEMLSNSSDATLKEAGFGAIAEMCLYQVLSPDAFSGHETLKAVIDRTADVAKTGNEPAALALGQMAMILEETGDEGTEASLLDHIIDRFHKMHEIRQAETHFAVGEALSYVACGWESSALATKIDIDAPKPQGPPRQKTLGKLLERTLRDCQNTKPALRKASVIWLLCLVQYCGHMTEVQTQLGACQVAFKRCLTDRDDLVQETASRGLGLVYEKGDRKLKDDLVRDLVGSFADNTRAQLSGTVSDDTQLFEAGALPTGDGSVTTYKDIMSLASEVGDSSLVYRFMAMASSNAIWSSRAAFGRFGLSNVLSDSSVDGYLADNPKLYPSLYRYRFDPNTSVQRSMNDIWNALVKDSAATIDKHFDAIMEDLLRNILSRGEWRVRQASCAAIADLVQGRQFDKYEMYLERIWNVCFKVLDDIKESVRAAAANLARVMTGILTRALEADNTASKKAASMLKHVLPFLLSTSGLESSAKEVQSFALHTLLEIIKKSSGNVLRSFIPELAERLLGLLGVLEPQEINYLHMNADKYNITEQKIDQVRLNSVRSSPLMEALERCLDLLDGPAMQELQPRLEAAMRSAVALPTKVGCSRVLVSLSTRHNQLFRPYSDHFLRLIEKYVLDRNETVSSSYAATAGYVARGASDKQILHLVTFAKRLYFESEGDRDQAVPRRSVAAGEIMHAVSKHASDRFGALAADLIPFVFVAKHDSNEQVRDLFKDTWSDNVGGPRAVSLYLTEILQMSQLHIDSPQWAVKHTVSRAIADATISIAGMSGHMDEAAAEVVWPALEKALGGKTWDGKEVVLDAFAKFVENGKKLWSKRSDTAQTIEKVAAREAKRQNPTYRSEAFKCLGRIAAARTDLDMSDAVYDIVHPVLSDILATDEQGDGMELDEPDKSRITQTNTLTEGVHALSKSINTKVLPPQALKRNLLRIIRVMSEMQTHAGTGLQVAVDAALARLVPCLQEAGVSSQLHATQLHNLLGLLEDGGARTAGDQ